MVLAPIATARVVTGPRFLTIPLRVYYIDMPGAGLPGSGIIGTGTHEPIWQYYDKGIGTTWRRDVYFWFQNPFIISTIDGTLYDDPMLTMAWNDLHYYARSLGGTTGQATRARIFLRPLAEDFDPTFSYLNLPAFHGNDVLAYAAQYNVVHRSGYTRSHEYNLEDDITYGQITIRTTGVTFNEGDEYWGFRLRWDWYNLNPSYITSVVEVKLGNFVTGDPDVASWSWPDRVWCWLWDHRE